MKKYFFIAIITGFVASCTNDNVEEFLPQNKEEVIFNQSTMLRDSTSIDDTGGQGGSTPIKPPKP